jgi:two-component system response regulator AtoC
MADPSTVAQTRTPRNRRVQGFQLLVMEDDQFGVHPLPVSGVVVLGRGETADVSLRDPRVSRRHARLHIGDVIEVEDLAGMNGTYVRGKRLSKSERIAIAPGETLELGHTIVVVQPRPGRSTNLTAPGVADAEQLASTPIPPHIVVADERLRRIYNVAILAAPSTINVLILGETGVGKELLAETVHQCSPRREGPLLCLNCATFSESLLESELFGYEKGAFTGAVQAKPGLLETAHGGTVFLDEVGEITPSLQGRLLRVLEKREVRRLGAVKGRSIDVRIVSATNRDLAAEVHRGGFRKDLYYRLNGLSLYVPPLRERTADIAPLSAQFIAGAARATGYTSAPRLAPTALALLEQHGWPGNVRELRNVIDRAVLFCRGGDIEPSHIVFDDLVEEVPSSGSKAFASPIDDGGGVKDEIAAVERRRITEAMEKFAGNQTRAAKHLGISRRTLMNRLDQYQWMRPRRR